VKESFGEQEIVMHLVKNEKNSTNVVFYPEVIIQFSCFMNFKMFPFDEQICSLEMMDLKVKGVEELRLVTGRRTLGDELVGFLPTIQEYEYEVGESDLTFSIAFHVSVAAPRRRGIQLC
jgi:hypothetical protein